jgi:hypothetical protein
MSGHYWGPVDDCIRCLDCEALVGTPGPCAANRSEEPPVEDDLPGPWVPFGTNVDLPDHLALEFSEADETGLPVSERVISP